MTHLEALAALQRGDLHYVYQRDAAKAIIQEIMRLELRCYEYQKIADACTDKKECKAWE